MNDRNKKAKRSRDRYRSDVDANDDDSGSSANSTVDRRGGRHRVQQQQQQQSFSFYSNKYRLNKLMDKLLASYLLEDANDFWDFVRKYEDMLRLKPKRTRTLKDERPSPSRSKNTANSTDKSWRDNRLNLPVEYDPKYSINVELTVSVQNTNDCLKNYVDDCLADKVPQFVFLVQLYFNFKQKEKIEALRKIRITQRNLPISSFKNEILRLVSQEKVVIIAGDTGCGKSTQIPQFLWHAGYNKIACTQPRRIACISLSKRVARETLTEYDTEVGYQIRFEKKRNSATKILFITEGLLLRQVSSEGLLSEYDVIVLDEVHERHLQGDFLLGISKCLLHQRDDLKLILMSATINVELFSVYFGALAKVIQIPGRLFPIDVRYFPIPKVERKEESFDPSPYIRIMQLIDSKYPKEEKGDVLMFLSGTKEITAVLEAAQLYDEKVNRWCILPLYSSLSLNEQDKAFDYPPEGFRKCVISTNIAETSVTIDGIRFVVDSGKVKEMSYDATCKLKRLKEFWISKASAEQRKGRAGRTGPGVCFRLYSESDYDTMNEYTTPEIQRNSLDSVLLQMIAMGLPDVRKFPFIEPPNLDSIENSLIALKQHGAIGKEEKLTDLGKSLSKLPVDLTVGKMLIASVLFEQTETILSLASALSVQSPFTNRAFRDTALREARKEFESDHGDPITLLNLFREWLKIKDEMANAARGTFASSYKTRKWCKRRGLEEQRFYEIVKLRSQFKDLLTDCGICNSDGGTCSKNTDEMTSAERASRHGELKQLRKLKRARENENDTRKPKMLKISNCTELEFRDDDESEEDTANVDCGTDLRDIEFRMKNDPMQVRNILEGSTAITYKDLTMIKIIVCSALYPQIAIPDEFNYSKTVKEQLFHTAEKPFVSLHPNCFFAFYPEVLHLDECDIVTPRANFKSKQRISSKHQILFYMSLLETTKIYLVNVLRMPAVQSIFLFAKEIRTNLYFNAFVCDNWIEIRFVSSRAGEKFITKVCEVRKLWEILLKKRLQGTDAANEVIMKDDMSDMILEFWRCDIQYTMKRLLAADIKAYTNARLIENNVVFDMSSNPFDEDFVLAKNEKYGGVDVTSFLVYNGLPEDDDVISVYDDEYDESNNDWKCQVCNLSITVANPFERLQHISTHKRQNNDSAGSMVTQQSKKPNSKLYECEKCGKSFYLTSIEILKHRREHTENENATRDSNE